MRPGFFCLRPFSFSYLLFLFLISLLSYAGPGDVVLPEWQKLRSRIPESSQNKTIVFIDFSLPSDEKRFFIVNPQNGAILFSAPTAHGKGSGRGRFAEHFSDEPGKYASTLGLFEIGGKYEGKHGLSIRLKGLEKQNANAEKRAVVIHKAWYCESDFIQKGKRCGNSWGCPALSEADFNTAMKWLQPGTFLYAYRSSELRKE